jgi:hypothetical protein
MRGFGRNMVPVEKEASRVEQRPLDPLQEWFVHLWLALCGVEAMTRTWAGRTDAVKAVTLHRASVTVFLPVRWDHSAPVNCLPENVRGAPGMVGQPVFFLLQTIDRPAKQLFPVCPLFREGGIVVKVRCYGMSHDGSLSMKGCKEHGQHPDHEAEKNRAAHFKSGEGVNLLHDRSP